MKFELGHNEIGDGDEPEYRLADDLVDLFTGVGLLVPRPVPVMRADHQIAQKLHAASSRAATGRVTSSTSSCWMRVRNSTSVRSLRRVSGCSPTDGSSSGLRP